MEQLLRYTRYKLLYMLYHGGLVHAQLQCERIQFKSHCGRLCLSRMPLQYAALGTGCVYLYCSLKVSSALHPSGVAKSSTSFSGNVTSAGWQVTLCDPMCHVSSRSGVAVLHCKRLYPYTVSHQNENGKNNGITKHPISPLCCATQLSICGNLKDG